MFGLMREKTVRKLVDGISKYYYLKGFEEGYCQEDHAPVGEQGAFLRGYQKGYYEGSRRNEVRKSRKSKKYDRDPEGQWKGSKRSGRSHR